MRFADYRKPETFEPLIDDSTKAIFVESLGNPQGNVTDIEQMAELAHRHGVPLIVDNTVPTPYLSRPFEHGADIIVHSLTKYLGGHGTSVGGAIVDSGKFPWADHKKRFRRLNEPDVSYHGVVYTEALGPAAYIGRARVVPLRNTGAAISPFNAFLILQGIQTLSLRMDRISESTLKIAQHLKRHAKVAWANYAGLEDHPDHALARKYLYGQGSGLLTFGLKGPSGEGRERGARFLDALQLFTRLVNIGDVRSLATHPASTTHRQLSRRNWRMPGFPRTPCGSRSASRTLPTCSPISMVPSRPRERARAAFGGTARLEVVAAGPRRRRASAAPSPWLQCGEYSRSQIAADWWNRKHCLADCVGGGRSSPLTRRHLHLRMRMRMRQKHSRPCDGNPARCRANSDDGIHRGAAVLGDAALGHGIVVVPLTRRNSGAQAMTDETAYTPPKVWTWNKENGGQFANINRPIAGPTHDKELPVGRHPLQLYSLATPNGVKVTVMLEELLALGHAGRRVRRLADQDQRGRPVRQRLRGGEPELQDPGAAGPQRPDADPRVRVRRDPAPPGREVRRLPADRARGARAECLSWLFWQMGSAPYLGGGFGHFYAYAPTKIEYAIDRFAMEVKRQLDVLDRRLAESEYLAGTSTRSPTWRSGPGTARWPRACSTTPASSCRSPTTSTSSAGPTRSPSARR